jgi:hypothetical protein
MIRAETTSEAGTPFPPTVLGLSAFSPQGSDVHSNKFSGMGFDQPAVPIERPEHQADGG